MGPEGTNINKPKIDYDKRKKSDEIIRIIPQALVAK
jgi:hypothetical protein